MAAHRNDLRPGNSPGPALEEAYELYRGELRRFFSLQSREPQCVEDLVQDVFEAILRYPARDRVQDPLGYLFRIAWHVVRGANRQVQLERHRYVRCSEAQLETLAQELGALWVRNDGGEALAEDEINKALGELPRACREALLLQRRDGLSYEEIARELNVSVHTVKDYIVKALNHFRTHFSMSER